MRTSPARRLALAIAVVAAVTACGADDPASDPAPTTSTTTTSTTTTSTTTTNTTTTSTTTTSTTTPTTTTMPVTTTTSFDDLPEAVRTAVDDLATTLGVDVSAITVARFEDVTWRDGSIGCPEPGLSYTQALVPGYRIELVVDGTSYWYHGARDRSPAYCANPVDPAPGGAADT